jgi:hypothetical protein
MEASCEWRIGNGVEGNGHSLFARIAKYNEKLRSEYSDYRPGIEYWTSRI